MRRIMVIGGARPNFMKVAPVVRALEKRGVEVMILHTGQHYDPELSDLFFEELGLRPPDVALGVGSGSQAQQTARIMIAFERPLMEWSPDIVVVVGDVNSTVACALVASKAGCRVAHVEAGLRSRDWSMPEEINRVVTDRVSDYLFAPSPDAVANLRREGYREDQIHLAGNVMIDSLLANLPRALERAAPGRFGLRSGEYGFVTLHRPSNVDDDETLTGILEGLERIAEKLPLLLPAHPRIRAALTSVSLSPNLRVVDPVGYLDSIALQVGARLVLTDSGGIQEETTVLGIPCLTLRPNTERPITVTEGTNRVVGNNPDRIVAAAVEVLTNGSRKASTPELWDGRAGERIALALTRSGGTTSPRPTDLPL
jgi:UDP-N-acetylglucosamine 2-epimerase (non-hydrolysing)